MPKKGKTKKQKILADSRRRNHTEAFNAAQIPTYSLSGLKVGEDTINKPEKTSPQSQVRTQEVSTQGYRYLEKDLRKTIILTTIIVVAQLLIKYFVK